MKRPKDKKRLHHYHLWNLVGFLLHYRLVADPLNRKLYRWVLPSGNEVEYIQASAINRLYCEGYLESDTIKNHEKECLEILGFKLSKEGFEEAIRVFRRLGITPTNNSSVDIDEISETSERYIG